MSWGGAGGGGAPQPPELSLVKHHTDLTLKARVRLARPGKWPLPTSGPEQDLPRAKLYSEVKPLLPPPAQRRVSPRSFLLRAPVPPRAEKCDHPPQDRWAQPHLLRVSVEGNGRGRVRCSARAGAALLPALGPQHSWLSDVRSGWNHTSGSRGPPPYRWHSEGPLSLHNGVSQLLIPNLLLYISLSILLVVSVGKPYEHKKEYCLTRTSTTEEEGVGGR